MRSFTEIAARPARIAALALALALFGGGVSTAQAATLPAGPSAPAPAPNPIDGYAHYQAQSTCSPTAKPGATYLLNLALSYYKIGRNLGITRACDIGGTSEHKEGRAFDWGVLVSNPAEKAAGDSFTNWLTAAGPDGKVGFNARRLGVMYVIWNKRIWSNSSQYASWRTYTGPIPHTDHVHVSLSWPGAWENTSWWTGRAIPDPDVTTRYVNWVYRDLFNRYPEPAGLASWSKLLNAGSPRVGVANAITRSNEYRSGLITGAYREFLGRDPDAGGLTTWLGAMAGGMTIQTMESGFVASQEYYNKAGGTDPAWVARLYQDVLGRTAGPSEVQNWVGVLAVTPSRLDVAKSFVMSTERLTTVVNGYYEHLLNREIDPGGLAKWVPLIQKGYRTEAVIGGIVSSAEYYTKAE
ncbi:DUF4214 domain-containing protein [Pengzhenrongella sp.]|jgi:hypothetical protein|uniref:DUF4214 domain-containing protein n=1 Tax=Pengzhenrongella sp. TaxID=2888820 RepID=UPI002F92C51B